MTSKEFGVSDNPGACFSLSDLMQAYLKKAAISEITRQAMFLELQMAKSSLPVEWKKHGREPLTWPPPCFQLEEFLGSYPGEAHISGRFSVGVRAVVPNSEGGQGWGRGMWSQFNYDLFNPPLVEDLGESAGYYAMCCPPYGKGFSSVSAMLIVAPRGETAYHEKGFRSASYEILAVLATEYTPHLWIVGVKKAHKVPVLTDIRQAVEWGLPVLTVSVEAMTLWSWSLHRRIPASPDAPR